LVNLPDFATSINGIDNRLTITTDSSLPPVITNTRLHTCTSGVFDGGVPILPAALGLNNGLAGADVFEAGISQNNLNLGGSRRVLIYFHTDSDTADDVVLTNGSGGPIALGFALPVNAIGWVAMLFLLTLMLLITRRHWSRPLAVGLVLVGVTGVVWAVTIMVDGLTGDWSAVNPANTDPANDTTMNGAFADLTAVFVT